MKTKSSTYPLRIPVSLKSAVERLSAEDGTSVNNFVILAIAEKISALETVRYFEQRSAKANGKSLTEVLRRSQANEPPIAGDELPKGWKAPRKSKSR